MIFAYIDPGAGSMVIQAVLAGVLAIPFLFRSAIARAIDRVRGRRAPSTSEKTDGGQLPD